MAQVFCVRTIIGQRTLIKLINRRASTSPCALQQGTTATLLTHPALTRTFTSVPIQWLQSQRNKPLLRRMGNQSKLYHYLYAYIHEYAIGFSLHTEQHLLRQASLIWLKTRRLLPWLASEFQTQFAMVEN